jgi:RND family efflux transporter MFP subunit
MSKSSIILIVGIAAISIAGLATVGCGSERQQAPPSPPAVTVGTPEVRDVTPVFEFTGTTEAVQSVEIRARVQGFLNKIEFKASSFVDKGDLLFEIEREPYIARRDRAEASLKSAEAALRSAESDLDRLEQAVKTNAVSQQEVTRARADRDQADAALLAARAELENAKIELAYTRIESPLAGLVSRNFVDLGNLVGYGEPTLLATVRKIDPIYAYFEVNERVFARILEEMGGHAGPDRDGGPLPATLVVRETGHESVGHVDSMDNTVDTATGTIMVRGVFPNPDNKIFPGFFVNIRSSAQVLKDAIVVRESAVGTDLGGKFLLLVGENNVVEQRYVQLGPVQDDGTVVVEEGLEGGERYIFDGLLRARPGMPVTPQTEAEAEGV